ncbi:MAG TPA: electron transfer flavoprotein subunit beta/FixA family protein [Planctomycetota bacterium]|nr:electron transfer flavoprotein subunit beta/FixA family protein [Planctomycetota bacterium]
MNIIVCVRRAPVTDARIKPGADGKNYDPAGVNYDISEYDKFALEAAIALKEKNPGSKVTAIILGVKDAAKELRTCIATGCEAGVLLISDKEHDAFATASALAAKIKTLPHDLVFFGHISVDNQSSAVGPMTAELLGIGCATVVTGLSVEGGVAHVEREIEGGKREKLDVKLPCALTCQKGLNKPRSASMKGIMAAKNTKLDEGPAAVPANLVSVLKMEPPAPRPAGKIVGEGPDAARKLVELLRNEAKVI